MPLRRQNLESAAAAGTRPSRMPQIFGLLISLVLVAGACNESPDPQFSLNSVEFLKQEKASLPEDEHFADSYREEIRQILGSLFGTPEDPKFPFLEGEEDEAHEFINLEDLKRSAGKVPSDPAGLAGKGLYREHCSHCHGITGNGAGPTAKHLNPYPRDFRLSKFKFKSTPLRRSPTDDDMHRILRDGIPGSAMPSFRSLPEEDLAALVNYVKYLTIRGQLERLLIAELESMDGEPLLELSYAEPEQGDLVATMARIEEDDREEDPSEEEELFEEQLDYILYELLQEGPLARWSNPDRSITKVPAAPAAIAPGHEEHQTLVDQGRELFFAKGNCAQCHGDTAMGDGQTASYDDWTNDWVKSAGVDPTDPSTYQDFLTAGALEPRPIRPRNLHEFVYRGGGRPQDLYRRIKNGIEGTPMPAGATLSEAEIWALVAYVKWLPFGHAETTAPKRVNDKAIAR